MKYSDRGRKISATGSVTVHRGARRLSKEVDVVYLAPLLCKALAGESGDTTALVKTVLKKLQRL